MEGLNLAANKPPAVVFSALFRYINDVLFINKDQSHSQVD
jgi:hypothetical protein